MSERFMVEETCVPFSMNKPRRTYIALLTLQHTVTVRRNSVVALA